MPRAGRSSPKNKKSRETESRSALSGKKPGNTVASARGGQKRKRGSAAPKAKLTASKTPQRIRVGYSRPMPVCADDDDAGTRTAIAELREEFSTLRVEITQLIKEVLVSVNAITECVTRSPDSGSNGGSKERNPSITDAKKEAGDHTAAHSQNTKGSIGSEGHNSADGESGSDIAAATPQADFVTLEDKGTHHRQLPLRLILAMFEAGATHESDVDTPTDQPKGFKWKDSGMAQTTLREKIRPILEESGFIVIPRRIKISEEARNGKAKRKRDAAGPGYLTHRGEAVARYMKDNGITADVLEKGRRKRM
jgi:hypothetical protein